VKHAVAVGLLSLGFGTILTIWLAMFFAEGTSDVEIPDPFYMTDDEVEWELEIWEGKRS
jgi:hypothetical protein